MFRRGQIFLNAGETLQTLKVLKYCKDEVCTNISCVGKNQYRAASSLGEKFKLPVRFHPGGESFLTEFGALGATYKPKANLGIGYSDFNGPDYFRQSMAEVANSKDPFLMQYTRMFGHPRLINVLAKIYSPLVCRDLDPMNEILVTIGSFEAMFAVIMGNVEPGDEVIIIEPFFECYEAMVKMASGIPRCIPLQPKSSAPIIKSEDWVLDEKELESLFNPRTKLILFNTPHNPTGKIYSLKEMEMIANLCKKFNVLCVADEVYERMVYGPSEHIRMATLPDMWERTITTSGAGKTYLATGCRLGWAYGPATIISYMQMVHRNSVFTVCTPQQEALAMFLEQEVAKLDTPECWFNIFPGLMRPKRDFLVKALAEVGLRPTLPEAGLFSMCEWGEIEKKVDLSTENTKEHKDYQFSKKMIKEASILFIPCSAFYTESHKHLGAKYIRFCFAKEDKLLQVAAEVLKDWYAKIK